MTGTYADGRQVLERRGFVLDLMARLPEETLVVTGLGSPSYDVFAAGHRPGNYHLWGAMGAAVPMGLGLALAQPERPVLVVTGDGEQLMGVGALGTVAVQSPANLTILVLDNGHFGETGMQRSHAGLGSDLTAIARGFGIADAETRDGSVAAESTAQEVAEAVAAQAGTVFRRVLIDTGEPPRAMPPRDGVANKNDFRAALGFGTF